MAWKLFLFDSHGVLIYEIYFFFYSWSINLSQSSELLFLQYKNNKPIYSCCNYLFLSFVWLQYNLKDKCHGLGVFWWRSYTYLKWPFPINSREARFFLCIHLNLNESSRCRSKMHAMLMRGTNHLQLVSKLKLYSYVVSPLINPKAADVCKGSVSLEISFGWQSGHEEELGHLHSGLRTGRGYQNHSEKG